MSPDELLKINATIEDLHGIIGLPLNIDGDVKMFFGAEQMKVTTVEHICDMVDSVLPLLDHIDEQAKQIALLKAALIDHTCLEAFWETKDRYNTPGGDATVFRKDAIMQLMSELPGVEWE